INHSIIGVRSVIKKGTIIKDSLLLGNRTYSDVNDASRHYSIGENCHIEKAIIDLNVQIGNNVTLTNKNNLQTYDGEGIFIRDGITIITSGTILPDNFTL
ncbi:MAG: glucose-1-phosphate adenylyltransferase, partial [Chlamydiia bacterium]|nr:glucose-1-phosphate adenylyltransferase [Chlamydiia bacterium]